MVILPLYWPILLNSLSHPRRQAMAPRIYSHQQRNCNYQTKKYPVTVQRHCFEFFLKQGGQDGGSPSYQSAQPSTGILISPSNIWEEKSHGKEALNSNSLLKKKKKRIIISLKTVSYPWEEV